MSAPGSEEPDWAAGYEALRAHALGEAPVEFAPLGLALLRHHGLTAWMLAEVSATRPQVGPARRGPVEVGLGAWSAPSSPPSPLQFELIGLLADTALHVARESWR